MSQVSGNIAPVSTEEDEHLLKKVFDRFDRDGSGQLSFVEVMGALQELGRSPDVAQKAAMAMMKFCDRDEDGSITFEEFKKSMLARDKQANNIG